MAEPEKKNPFSEPEVAPGAEMDTRQAWQNRPRASKKENIRPAPSLAFNPDLKTSASDSAAEPPKEDGAEAQKSVARRLRNLQAAKRAARAKEYEAASLGGSVEGKFKKFKQIKNIVRVVRGASLAGTSLGDIFFSLGALFLSLVGEWILSKFMPGYQLFPKDDPLVLLDKILWYLGWAVVVSALLLITLLIIVAFYISENPSGALRLLTS